MFYRIKLPCEHRNYLRFFWFPIDNLSEWPIKYWFTVHIFSAKSSPSCANYALQYFTTMNVDKFSEQSIDAVKKDFYINDFVKSTNSIPEASLLINEVTEVVKQDSFNLTEFISNSKELLWLIPKDKLSKRLQSVDIVHKSLPYERALGVKLNVEDTLGISLNFKDKDKTKWGVLSTTFSIYNLLGFVCTAILPAKRIFQVTCKDKLAWDELLPDNLLSRWTEWLAHINLLSKFQIFRCYCTKSARNTQLQLGQ